MNKKLTPLEALEKIKDNMAYQIQLRGDCVVVPYFDIVETALKDYENLKLKHKSIQDAVLDDFKKLKAFEIIKEKKVNVGDFVRCETLDDYNDYCCYGDDEHLTETEFDLLTEELK